MMTLSTAGIGQSQLEIPNRGMISTINGTSSITLRSLDVTLGAVSLELNSW